MKKEMLSTLSALKKAFPSTLIHNNYKQESKIDHKIAVNKFIRGTYLSVSLVCTHVDPLYFCREPGLLPSHYFNSIACSLIKRINLPMERTVA